MTAIQVVALIGSQGMLSHIPGQSGSGVGKDEVAKILVNHHGYVHLKFADELRRKFYERFSLPVEVMGDKEFEGSYYLSDYKTITDLMIEFAASERAKDKDIFVKELLKTLIRTVAIHKVSIHHTETLKVVISDLRQFNEWLMISALRGQVVEVIRDKPSRSRQKLDCQLLALNDFRLVNNQDLDALIEVVRRQEGHWVPSCTASHLDTIYRGYMGLSPFRNQ